MARPDSRTSATHFSRFSATPVVALLLSAFAAPLAAQTDNAPFACGTHRTLHSAVLGEERTLLGSFALYKPELTPLMEETLKQSAGLAQAGKKLLFVANGKLDTYDPDGSRTRRGAQFLDSLSRSAPETVTIETAVYDDEGHVPFGFVYDGLKWLESVGGVGVQ